MSVRHSLEHWHREHKAHTNRDFPGLCAKLVTSCKLLTVEEGTEVKCEMGAGMSNVRGAWLVLLDPRWRKGL